MTGSLVSPVLVGRQREAADLAEALARVTAGASATVLVSGEAGVGKSRLVHEVVEQTGTAGAHALVGNCVELDGGGIPFAPLVDMVRTLARHSSPRSSMPCSGPRGPKSDGSCPNSTMEAPVRRSGSATPHGFPS